MEYRILGNTGLKVSAIALGCLAFCKWIGEAESRKTVEAALDAGINLLDTADAYGVEQKGPPPYSVGASEEILGKVLRGRRHEVVLATKVRERVGALANDEGLTRHHIFEAVDASLRRLQTDHIDLYQLHHPDPTTPIEETLRALDDVVRAGKVRYIGCSNYAAWQIAKMHGISSLHNLAQIVSVQPRYNLLAREIELELLPFCRAEQVGVIVYSPLARGLLTGKYEAGKPYPDASRAQLGDWRLRKLLEDERHWRLLLELKAWAEGRGVALATLALSWVFNQPGVTSAILGASKPEHISSALAALELRLTTDDRAALDNITL